MSMDSGQGESLCTPRRAQKCLFAVGSNSSKDAAQNLNNSMSSGEESDLGPMSPLAFSDQSPSTCDSSSGREFVSPFTTPDKLRTTSMSWDRLLSVSLNSDSKRHGAGDDSMSPFSSLKKLTKTARYSPRCRLFNSNSPRSLPSSPSKLLTSRHSKTRTTANEVIPETPQRSFATEIQNCNITETPQKSASSNYRQMSLDSITKSTLLPRCRRRKSLSTLETGDRVSPEKENTLKRHARDELATNPAKFFRVDDALAPRARAALFQERKSDGFNLKDFSLSTKSFYSGNARSERPFVVGNLENGDVSIKRRQSLPARSGKHLLKKQRFGVINSGVFHRIKRPKVRKVSSKAVKTEEQRQVIQNPTAPELSDSSPVEHAQPVETGTIAKRVPSPEVDENKRFFKTNKTIRTYQAATVTVSKSIKLKVTDGKIVLNQKRIPSTSVYQQQSKTMNNVSYDTTDLSVDEPEVEAMLEQNKVANILKILEDDWANDDYDTMEILTIPASTVSPPKSTTSQQDTIMSPASELSSMTSTMNIKDASPTENLSLNKMEKNNDTAEANKESEERYFPLFTKGYSMSNNSENIDSNKSKPGKKNMQWQLSTKGGGAEDQYQLDVGQKRFGATQCTECNIVYQLGDPEDENAHLNYHNSIRILRFQGWKTERVIMEDSFTSSRIILVEPHDSKHCWKKVSEIMNVVDRDLGLTDMKISDYQNKTVFLYIRDKQVLGVLVAEHVNVAYRMIPELIELNCCTAESTPTKCGINVVWTAMSHRKQGIATKLVNTLRAKFFYGYVMSLDDIAFSTPSPSGKIFAEKYTKTKNFKVYN